MTIDQTPSDPNSPESDDFFSDEMVKKPLGPLDGKPGYKGLMAVAVTYLCVVILSGIYWTHPPSKMLAISYHTAIVEGRYWQMFTALFVHSGMMHLISNTPMFLVFGYLLRGYFGPLVFPFSCILVGALANYLTILGMPQKQFLVGISGMIYAMVAMWMAFYLRFETNYRIPERLFRSSAVSLILMFPTTYSPTTSYAAHGWGFLLGALSGIAIGHFIKPKSDTSEPSPERPLLH